MRFSMCSLFFLLHTEWSRIPKTGHCVSTLSKSTVFSKSAICSHANVHLFVFRFCSLKADTFESFVSSKVNMTLKDFWFNKRQPQILKLSVTARSSMTLGQVAPSQMDRRSSLPYTLHNAPTNRIVGLCTLAEHIRRTCDRLVSLSHSWFDF